MLKVSCFHAVKVEIYSYFHVSYSLEEFISRLPEFYGKILQHCGNIKKSNTIKEIFNKIYASLYTKCLHKKCFKVLK